MSCCQKCVDRWLVDMSRTCPACRADVVSGPDAPAPGQLADARAVHCCEMRARGRRGEEGGRREKRGGSYVGTAVRRTPQPPGSESLLSFSCKFVRVARYLCGPVTLPQVLSADMTRPRRRRRRRRSSCSSANRNTNSSSSSSILPESTPSAPSTDFR